MWHLFETVHAVTYFAEETRAGAAGLGLRGFWAGYVVFRAAPLGTATASVVVAAFHGFGPSRVAKALPAAWDVVSPAQAREGLERWQARHPDAAGHLQAADVLVDRMRGSSSLWYRIRVNLQHVPEELRPPQEELEVDYDPWAGRTWPGRPAP